MKIYVILTIFLLIGAASAAENTVNGTIENSDPVITDFVLNGASNDTSASIGFTASISDDNGITTLNSITFTVINEPVGDEAPVEILSRTYTPWSAIAPLSTYDTTSLRMTSPMYTVPHGAYLCSLNVYDPYSNAYTDSRMTLLPVASYSVTPISFPKTKVLQTVDTTFSIVNPTPTSIRVGSVTFTSLSVGSQSIPVSSIVVDLPSTPIPSGSTVVIPCHLTVPSGISAGTLTGTGVITLADA